MGVEKWVLMNVWDMNGWVNHDWMIRSKIRLKICGSIGLNDTYGGCHSNDRGQMHNRNSVVAILGPFPNQTVVGIVLGEEIFFLRWRHNQGVFKGVFKGQLLKSKQNLNSLISM